MRGAAPTCCAPAVECAAVDAFLAHHAVSPKPDPVPASLPVAACASADSLYAEALPGEAGKDDVRVPREDDGNGCCCHGDAAIGALRHRLRQQRDGLSLASRPLLTLRYFALAVAEQLAATAAAIGGSRAMCGALMATGWALALMVALDRADNKLVHEALAYLRFGVWWVCLGIASSIGFGSGLHTFVLYLSPHLARFTLKATACGRPDIKLAPHDTAQWASAASWAARHCSALGPPLFPHVPSAHGGFHAVPLALLLRAVLPEVLLWGAGTAVGELPPFLVARAARLSGESIRSLEGQAGDEQGEEDEGEQHDSWLHRLFLRFLPPGHRFGFGTIFLLAAVPNPIFDLAGITCGHLLIPCWKFLLATLLGKGIVKTTLQAAAVVFLFHEHSVDLIESLLERLLSHLPFLSSLLPPLLAALDSAKQRVADGDAVVVAASPLSLGAVWSAVVTLMILSFLASVVTTTARTHLLRCHARQLLHAQQRHRHALCSLHGIAAQAVGSGGEVHASREGAEAGAARGSEGVADVPLGRMLSGSESQSGDESEGLLT
ncbi:hypothetical protein CLOM_g9796 [Closterium sp. NIES-68]|nr:hypothetical protein CLOM_g9796 [Closterium sp. NIES-68]GJP71196.1 hypothetical protein CLOP_g2043 [Closterium sp. NIES-67]